MVVGFHFHQNVRRFLVEVITTILVVSEETPNLRTFHHRGVVFIGRQHIVRGFLEGVFDHFEQRFWLLFAVNHPVGVENFMTAVFRVRLREHVEFNIIRVAAKAAKRILQIINFVFRQCQAETHVSVNQRLTPFT